MHTRLRRRRKIWQLSSNSTMNNNNKWFKNTIAMECRGWYVYHARDKMARSAWAWLMLLAWVLYYIQSLWTPRIWSSLTRLDVRYCGWVNKISIVKVVVTLSILIIAHQFTGEEYPLRHNTMDRYRKQVLKIEFKLNSTDSSSPHSDSIPVLRILKAQFINWNLPSV